MLYLLCRLGAVQLAVPVRSIIEVLPAIAAAPAPGAASGHLGAIDHRGEAVPLLDLGVLFDGQPTATRLSTRVLVVKVHGSDPVAFLVAGATDTRRLAEQEFRPVARHPQTAPDTFPFLHPEVCFAAEGSIYRLNLESFAGALLRPGTRAEHKGYGSGDPDTGRGTGAIRGTKMGTDLGPGPGPGTDAPPDDCEGAGWQHAAA